MQTIKTIHPLLEKIKEILNNVFNVKEIVLFGSYAWGNPSSDSDIDLAIVLEGITKPNSFLERIKRNAEVNSYIAELSSKIAIDSLVYSKEEWDLLLKEKSELITEIENRGVKLYEKKN